jgi:E3 ubiquitin-protein ligase makorin
MFYSIYCSKKHCRYYKNGKGECPFGNKCFYLHALQNGKKIDVGPPRRRRKRENANGEASDDQVFFTHSN